MPDMLELQYELESKAAKWYATTDIAWVFPASGKGRSLCGMFKERLDVVLRDMV